MQENWIGKSQRPAILLPARVERAGRRSATSRCSPPGPTPSSAPASSPSRPAIRSPRRWPPSGPRSPSSSPSARAGGTSEAEIETAEKLGFDTGLEVVHPFDPDWRLPVWIANFVLMEYGTGALYGVPAHDARDFEFATKYRPADPPRGRRRDGRRRRAPVTEAETEPGIAVNSRFPRRDGDRRRRRPRSSAAPRPPAGARARPNIGCATGACRASAIGARRSRSSIAKLRPGRRAARPAAGRAAGGRQLRRARQPARPPPDLGQGRLPAMRRPGPARDRHARHLRRFQLVLHPLRQPARRPAVRPRRGREMAAGRPIYRRRRACDPAPALRPLLDPRAASGWARSAFAEPFKGLFTQGMVTHETYRQPDGRWLNPDEVEVGEGGALVERATGAAGQRGRVEKMSKSKKNTVDPEPILDRYGADAVRWFMLSDSAARARPRMVGERHRGRGALRPARLAAGAGARPAIEGEDVALRTQAPPHHRRGRRGDRGAAVQQVGRRALRADQRDREGQALGHPRRGDPHPAAAGLAGRAASRRGGLGGARRAGHDRRCRLAEPTTRRC